MSVPSLSLFSPMLWLPLTRGASVRLLLARRGRVPGGSRGSTAPDKAHAGALAWKGGAAARARQERRRTPLAAELASARLWLAHGGAYRGSRVVSGAHVGALICGGGWASRALEGWMSTPLAVELVLAWLQLTRRGRAPDGACSQWRSPRGGAASGSRIGTLTCGGGAAGHAC